MLYQSHSRSAPAASRRSNRRSCRPDGARPVLDALDPHGAAGLDRGLGDARALGLVRAVEHRHERDADGVGGEPDAAGPDVGGSRSTTRNETPVTSSSRRTCDTISSSVRRSHACEARGVLDAALLQHGATLTGAGRVASRATPTHGWIECSADASPGSVLWRLSRAPAAAPAMIQIDRGIAGAGWATRAPRCARRSARPSKRSPAATTSGRSSVPLPRRDHGALPGPPRRSARCRRRARRPHGARRRGRLHRGGGEGAGPRRPLRDDRRLPLLPHRPLHAVGEVVTDFLIRGGKVTRRPVG